MRIGLIHTRASVTGGAETYLAAVARQLGAAGHRLALLTEEGFAGDGTPILADAGVPRWAVDELGADPALAGLAGWRPEILFSQGLEDPSLEARLHDIAPGVFFAHAYYGTCISGYKRFAFPVARPCSRRFGPACLLQYFPRRCGGLGPGTMLRDYRRQSRRLEVVARYAAVVTASRHMRREYLAHGLPPDRVVHPPYPAFWPAGGEASEALQEGAGPGCSDTEPDSGGSEPRDTGRLRLLFLGRLSDLKGGHLLLEALPAVARALGRPLKAVFCGDGPKRQDWEASADRAREKPGVSVSFCGWLPPPEVSRLLGQVDLLVVPSVWPEPFGLVGIEAAAGGIPAAGFATGGIPEWLADGVNGHLAAADPPTVRGLVGAITACLEDPDHYRRLRQGARSRAREMLAGKHTEALVELFERVLAERDGGRQG